MKYLTQSYYHKDLFTLTETDSGTDSDSDSKPNGYIVLCRTCSDCTDSDSLLSPFTMTLTANLGHVAIQTGEPVMTQGPPTEQFFFFSTIFISGYSSFRLICFCRVSVITVSLSLVFREEERKTM